MNIANHLNRRRFLYGSGVSLVSSPVLAAQNFAARHSTEQLERWIAKPPAGFRPLHRPGVVQRVSKLGDYSSYMQGNGLWPKAEVARRMLELALREFTGAKDIPSALACFLRPEEKVALKINGIAGQNGATMAFNFEFLLPIVEGLIAMGIAPENIMIFEQHASYLRGARVTLPGYDLPKGVRVGFHSNHDAVMPAMTVYDKVPTRFVRHLTEADAVIDLTQMKDHSICGYTGTLKNLTYGQIVNPHDHHSHRCNPQIPVLYNFPILRSRVRLHIVDAIKVIYDEGPTDKNPLRRVPHGQLYVGTDPVALDRIGWSEIDRVRQQNGLQLLSDSGRRPDYIETAGELGLGEASLGNIILRESRC